VGSVGAHAEQGAVVAFEPVPERLHLVRAGVREGGREEGEHDRLVAEAVRQVERFDLVGHERGR